MFTIFSVFDVQVDDTRTKDNQKKKIKKKSIFDKSFSIAIEMMMIRN